MLDGGFPQKLQHVAKKLYKHSCEWQFSFPHCCSNWHQQSQFNQSHKTYSRIQIQFSPCHKGADFEEQERYWVGDTFGEWFCQSHVTTHTVKWQKLKVVTVTEVKAITSDQNHTFGILVISVLLQDSDDWKSNGYPSCRNGIRIYVYVAKVLQQVPYLSGYFC
jgi:hypothetical protein